MEGRVGRREEVRIEEGLGRSKDGRRSGEELMSGWELQGIGRKGEWEGGRNMNRRVSGGRWDGDGKWRGNSG